MKYRVYTWSAVLAIALASCAGSTSGNLPNGASPFTRSPHAAPSPAVVVGYFQDPDSGKRSGMLIFGSTGNAQLQTIAAPWPYALLADPLGGYFARFNGIKGMYVVEYSASGKVTRTLGGLTSPGAMATDSHGNLYVIDSGTTVLEFAPNTTAPTRTAATGTNLTEVAIDDHGRLYVSSIPPNPKKMPASISEYAPGGSTASLVLGFPVKPAYLTKFAVDPARSLIYAVVQVNYRYQNIDVFPAGASKAPRAFGAAGSSSSIVVGPNGRVYIFSSTRQNRGRLQEFSPRGEARVLNELVTDNAPSVCGANPSLAVDALGDAYVADCQTAFVHPTGKVYEYSPGGRFMRTLTGKQDVPDVPTAVVVLH